MSDAPDLAGFADAQERLRNAFGEECQFLQKASVTFGVDVAIDPETNLPFDPFEAPSSSGQASASGLCTVAFRARGLDNKDEASPAGWMAGAHVLLISSSGLLPMVSGAVTVEVRDARYKVISMKLDGIGGVQRLVTYGRLE